MYFYLAWGSPLHPSNIATLLLSHFSSFFSSTYTVLFPCCLFLSSFFHISVSLSHTSSHLHIFFLSYLLSISFVPVINPRSPPPSFPTRLQYRHHCLLLLFEGPWCVHVCATVLLFISAAVFHCLCCHIIACMLLKCVCVCVWLQECVCASLSFHTWLSEVVTQCVWQSADN